MCMCTSYHICEIFIRKLFIRLILFYNLKLIIPIPCLFKLYKLIMLPFRFVNYIKLGTMAQTSIKEKVKMKKKKSLLNVCDQFNETSLMGI